MGAAETKAVFLSYASQDAEAAQRICEALRAAGVEVWFDQNELVGGDAWDAKIRGQIAGCALFVPVISANTQARLEGYFRLEWKLAAQRTHTMADEKVFLLPVVIDDTRDAEAKVPAEFRAVQWTRLRPVGSGAASPAELDGRALAAFVGRVQRLRSGGEDTEAPRPTAPPAQGAAPRSAPKLVPVLAAAAALVVAGAAAWIGWPRAGGEKPAAPAAVSEAPGGDLAKLRARIVPDRWQKGDFEAIAPLLDRLLQANPADADAWALSSIVNSLQVVRLIDPGTRPLENGRNASERALRLAPESALAHLARGLHLVAMISRGGDPLACRASVDRAVAALPPDPLTRYVELVSHWLSYDFAATDRVARAWLDAEPAASFPAWILLSKGLASRQPAEMERWGSQSVSDPNITGVRTLLNLTEMEFFLRSDLAAGRGMVDRVAPSSRAIARVVHLRWLVAMAEERWDAALQELALVPDAMLLDVAYNGPKAFLAGQSHLGAGRREAALVQFREAERLLREALAADPENEALRVVFAATLAFAGRGAEARNELALVEPLVRGRLPNVYRARLVVALAQTYLALDDHAAAAFWLRKLFAEPSSVPLTPRSLRLDPRFRRAADEPEIRALLAEFAQLEAAPRPAAAADGKSVAVLAFKNLSDDRDTEYFSDGVSEELGNVLGRVPGLRVAASTSAFSFKGKAVPVAEIARQLGVAYVVEGSVRKMGATLRINAKLVQASDGFPVWSSGNLEREVKNIFALQDEIAGLIAQALSLKLGVGNAASIGSVNPEAFELVVRARAAWKLRSFADYDRAEDLLNRALALDPNFARAHAALADVWFTRAQDKGTLGGFTQRNSPEHLRILGKINQALALDPNLAEARASLGGLGWTTWQLADGERELRRAISLNPNYATAHQWLGRLLLNDGRMDEALAELRLAAEIDPLSPRILDNYGLGLYLSGRYRDAVAINDRALAMQPDSIQTLGGKALALAASGQLSEAVAVAQKIPSDPRNPFLRVPWMRVLANSGSKTDVEALLPSFNVREQAEVLLALGRSEEALALLGPESLFVNSVANYLFDPLYDSVRNDPRAARLWAAVGLTEAHARAQAWRAANPPEKPAAKP